jgi:L-cysteine:1D-myo-inositol 2-amino-2-deoxy-alpha-D-glucopyranoside ligase
MLAVYDTLRGRRVAFRPRGHEVTLYVCGVTPYDTTHLGHARTFLVFDVLVRHLEARGLRVRYAQNVTDIDESILQRAAQRGEDWRALGRREERALLADMRRLGWRVPDVMPHATREIAAMGTMAQRLVRRRHGYRLPRGSVYFDVSSFRRYGALSRYSVGKMRRLSSQQDDAALDDPARRNPLDFALWRRIGDGPTWPSPFGRGRPGWHLECSAMSLRHLGHPIDIHGGGSDLIYPHHESEIAQSEAASARRFVRYWMHVAMVNLDGEKMSKSKGNMVFVRDALRRFHPDGLRLYLLSRHYRRVLEYDESELKEWDRFARSVREVARGSGAWPVPRRGLVALDDDLDTPATLALLKRLTSQGDGRSVRALARHIGLTLRA